MKNKMNVLILIGLLLGVVGGIFLPEVMKNTSFVGTIYINLLKFMIMPILFTNLTVSIYNAVQKRTKLIIKTITLFILMFTLSFLITAIVMKLSNFGANFTFEEIAWESNNADLSVNSILTNLFPPNIAKMISDNALFACIITTIVMGIAARNVEDGDKAIGVIRSFRNIFNKMLEYIMYLTPVAVFSLIGTTIANYGYEVIKTCIKYIFMAYGCGILVLIFIMIIPVWIIKKISPITYIKKVWKIWTITLTTCSSAATLPYTIKVCNEEFKVPEEVTDVVVPLGCTIHMCGGAVSFAILGIFSMHMFGIEITLAKFILMLLAALFINMSAPGIPGGGIVIGATYLSMFGIPLSFIGIYSGIYKILDMMYTTLNVTGDISANIILNEEKQIERRT